MPICRGTPFANLDLTADQQKRLAELRDASDRKVVAQRNDMINKSSELRRLWSAPKPDRQAIQKTQAEMDQIRKQIRDARTEYHLAMLELLTPEQREKLQATQGPGFGPGFGARLHGRGSGFGPGMGTGPRGHGFGRGSGCSGMGPGQAL